ncbi:MAG: glycosyltransferase family 2 protein [Vicinamibacteria bacterium]
MTVAVVIATHDRPRRLAQLLAALRAQTPAPDEVLVVDDGSAEGTAAVLAAELERGQLPLHVVRREQAAGPATARDQGWRASASELVAFTDDDCAPDQRWLAEVVRAAQRSPGSFVQGRTLPNPEEIDGFGPFSRSIWVRELDPAFQTCNIAYPRELLERIDGFDVRTFGLAPGGEDCDLGWRAIEAGARPVFAPEALVHHAVDDLGPVGKLRVAARWTTPMTAYARHPELRRSQFRFGIFWKEIHWMFFKAVIGALLPARLHLLKAWLLYPYLRDVWARGRVEGGGVALAPYFMLHDLIEVAAVARAGVRTRTPML